jgi:hypothetical protein
MNKDTILQDSLPSNVQMNKKTFQKMLFIMNALENGWVVKKTNDLYIFTKKHEGKREVFQENYLETFLRKNLTENLIQFDT